MFAKNVRLRVNLNFLQVTYLQFCKECKFDRWSNFYGGAKVEAMIFLFVYIH